MSDPRHQKVDKRYELERFQLNMETALERGINLDARTIQLTEDIEEFHFDFFDTAMTLLESQNRRKIITIKINSYGGDVHTALAIIGRMQESTCAIHTKGYGKIMSASTAILAAGDKRSISRLSEFMHHEMSYEVGGKHSEILHNVKQAQTLSERWCTLMFELTGTPIDYWMQQGKSHDFYMSPELCLELNVVDRIF